MACYKRAKDFDIEITNLDLRFSFRDETNEFRRAIHVRTYTFLLL